MINHKEVLNVLDALTCNGELRDYDDEIANRVEDAKEIVRSYGDLLAAAKRVIFMYGDIPHHSAIDALQAVIAKAEEL